MRKARAAALEESTEHLISTIGLGEILRIVTNKGELISKGEEMFDDFLRTINTEILGADLIDVGLVLGDYFETKPPFENSEKKKSEFPDAFIAQQIRKRFGETEEVVIISNDKGFIRACGESENHLFFSSLGKLYNAISKEDAAYDETMAVIKDLQLRISAAVKEYIKGNENIDVHGLSYDKDGIESGYDYSEVYLHSISDVTFSVHSVDEISEINPSSRSHVKQIFPLIAIMRIMPMPLGIRKKKNMYLLIRYKCARNIKHGLGAELRLTEKQRHSKCFRL